VENTRSPPSSSDKVFTESRCSGRDFMPVVQQADYAALNGTRQCDMLLLENGGWVWAEDLVCLAPLLIDFSRGLESPLAQISCCHPRD